MAIIDPKPETIRNRILEAVMNRLETVVDGYYVRLGGSRDFVGLMEITLDGVNPVLTRNWNRVFKFSITGVDSMEYAEWINDEETQVGDAVELTGVVDGFQFPLADTGRVVTMVFNSLAELPTDGNFEIHLGNRCFTVRGAYRWDRVVMNKVMPSMVVFPQKEEKKAVINDRYDCTLDIALTLWIESEPEGYSQLEEYIGEIVDVLSQNVSFGECLNYDSEVSDIRIVDADGTSENLGAYIELLVNYRHDARNTRVKR